MLNAMQKAVTKKIVSARRALIVFIVFSFLLLVFWISLSGFLLLKGGHKLVRAPRGTFHVSIAAKPKERELGLSNTKKLQKNEGKLFVFDSLNRHGFWMKDMNYPIDIIWLDSDKKVVHIENSVEPYSYPDVYYANEPDMYVLEIASGAAVKADITKGSTLKW